MTPETPRTLREAANGLLPYIMDQRGCPARLGDGPCGCGRDAALDAFRAALASTEDAPHSRSRPVSGDDGTNAELRTVLVEILQSVDHDDCRASGPEAEAGCIIDGLNDRAVLARAALEGDTIMTPETPRPPRRRPTGASTSSTSVMIARLLATLDRDRALASTETCVLGRFGLTPHSHHCTAVEDRAALASTEEAPLDVERLAAAWAEVMDGRRIGAGLNAARINGDTTTADDWQAIAAAYQRTSPTSVEIPEKEEPK